MRAAILHPRLQRGMMLIDCICYIALLSIVLSLAFMAFYRTTDNSKNLARNAADICRTLQAGERWREEVRTAGGVPRLDDEGGAQVFRLPHANGDISYTFRDGAVWRRALPATNWVAVLPAAAASTMRPETRQHVTSWHWDVELQGKQKVARLRPLFSFQAVNTASKAP